MFNFVGKRFRQRVSYLVHRRIHTGVMPYKCSVCDKTFRYKVSQRSHKCSGNISSIFACDILEKNTSAQSMDSEPISNSGTEIYNGSGYSIKVLDPTVTIAHIYENSTENFSITSANNYSLSMICSDANNQKLHFIGSDLRQQSSANVNMSSDVTFKAADLDTTVTSVSTLAPNGSDNSKTINENGLDTTGKFYESYIITNY